MARRSTGSTCPATCRALPRFETSDLLALIPVAGLLGVLLKQGKRVIGPLAAIGKDLEMVKIFVKTFSRTGGAFQRILPNGQKIVLESDGFQHMINRHLVDFFNEVVKKKNTMWPLGTAASKVVRYLDEAIGVAGNSLKPGWNENIRLANGIVVRLYVDAKYVIKTFHPVSGPGVFELKNIL